PLKEERSSKNSGIEKEDTDPQLRLKKRDGAEGAPLSLQKKMMALQKSEKDPVDSLHQCETCWCREMFVVCPKNNYNQGQFRTRPGHPFHPWHLDLPLIYLCFNSW
ncbi:Testis-expressed protein 35, partial [Camelus dromedarius]